MRITFWLHANIFITAFTVFQFSSELVAGVSPLGHVVVWSTPLFIHSLFIHSFTIHTCTVYKLVAFSSELVQEFALGNIVVVVVVAHVLCRVCRLFLQDIVDRLLRGEG
jgi:hypothetical protein